MKKKAVVQRPSLYNALKRKIFSLFLFFGGVALGGIICSSSVSTYERYNQGNYWLRTSSSFHCLSCHVKTMELQFLPTLEDLSDLPLLYLLAVMTWNRRWPELKGLLHNNYYRTWLIYEDTQTKMENTTALSYFEWRKYQITWVYTWDYHSQVFLLGH